MIFGKYHRARERLKCRIEDTLRQNVQAREGGNAEEHQDVLDAKCDQILDEFEELIITRYQSNLRRGFWSYGIGVSQSIVAACISPFLVLAAVAGLEAGHVDVMGMVVDKIHRMMSAQQTPALTPGTRPGP